MTTVNLRPMMECGHAANSLTWDKKPACAICFGIKAGATIVAAAPPDLTGREAGCSYCGALRPSSPLLPFFEHCPTLVRDRWYCGCKGWD